MKDKQLADMILALRPRNAPAAQSNELLSVANDLQIKVGAFLTQHNFASLNNNRLMVPNASCSLESIQMDMKDGSGIDALLEQARIPMNMRAVASETIALLFCQHFNQQTGGGDVLRSHLTSSQESTGILGLDTLFTQEFAGQLNTSIESFGSQIDQTQVDLKLAITVALMRFHMGITPRLLPTRVTSSPAIQIKVPRVSVWDLSDPTAAPTPMINLFSNPAMVNNLTPTIVPLESNDELIGNNVLVSDGILRFNKEVPMLTLGIDANKPGYSKINHTDTVADGVKLSKVRVSITLTDGEAGTLTDTFDLTIPSDKNRLTRLGDSVDAADRALLLSHKFFLGHTTVNSTGVASAVFADADVDAGGKNIEGVSVNLNGTIRINLKSGVCFGQASAEIATHQVATAALSEAFTAVVAGGVAVTLVGYIMDAKYSEENLRKSAIAARIDSRTMQYEIPLGRMYTVDTALNQEMAEELPGHLTRILQLGEDNVALTAIHDALDNVRVRVAESAEQGLDNIDVGRNYAAGCMVKPTVIVGTFTISDLLMNTDEGRSGAIKERLIRYLVAITTRMQAGSFIKEQIAAGAKVVYRMATTVKILGCVIGVEHSRSNLEKGAMVNDASGVEYRLELPNGVVIEVVTTNFASQADTMTIVPYVQDNPDSSLNMGAIYDMGAIVGRTTYASHTDGAHNRMFAHARQQVVPLNPVGAIITVVGAYEANENSYAA